MIDWTDVAKTLGSTAIICAAIIFITKTFWSQLLARDLEGFKAKLENRNSVEIERLRSDLKRVAFEHETRYVKLHEKRAEILEELFKRLVRANEAFVARFRAGHFAGEPSIEDQTVSAAKAANEFLDWFSQNRLFIDDPIADQIVAINKHFQELWFSLGPVRPEDRQKATKEFFEKTPALIEDVRRRMLDLLAPQIPN
jgi:hypothetical protein